MFHTTKLARALWVVCGGVLLSAGNMAMAQSQQLDRVTVTGSNIKRTDTETSTPVQVITREEIQRSGKQSIQEVLRTITADNQGSIPTSFSGGFAAGSAAVSLRGLGVNNTLVLVNGRRMSTYGLADDGARTFVDVNSIPLEAVDSVEILKGSASAIYGSDAVGGVVNIKLRRNYNGASVGGSVGQSGHSDGRVTRTFGSVGFGDLDADRYNVFATLEATKEKAIPTRSRGGYIGNEDLRSIGFYDNRIGGFFAGNGFFPDGSGPAFSSTTPYGTVRLPGGTQSQRINLTPCPEISSESGVCSYDTGNDTEIQPRIERLNFFTRGTLQITPSTTGYAELGLFYTRTRSNGSLGGVNDGGVYNPADPANPLVQHTTIIPAAHPDNPTGVDRTLSYLPAEFGGRDGEQKNKVTRLVAGVQGNVFDWDYDVGAGYIKSDLTDINRGYIRYSQMQAALNGTLPGYEGQFYRINNPGALPAGMLQTISPDLQRKPTSSVALFDFKVNKELFALGGGNLAVALGTEYRREKTDTPPVPFTDTSDIVGLGYSAFSGSRNVKAVFGEVNAPVTKWLELQGALRYDKYSDYGSSTTPAAGIKIKPIDSLLIRGSYAEAFRAPGPTESGNSSSLGFTSIAIVSIGDPSVKPEESTSKTIGVVYEPVAGHSVALDYYNIKREKEIVQADPAAILGNAPTTGAPSSRIAGSQPNSFIYYDDTGTLAAVSGPYANAAQTKTDGLDFELRNRFNLGSAGKITTILNWTRVLKFQRTLADGTAFEYAGYHGPLALSSGGATPRDRGTFSLSYDSGPWTGSVQINYVGPFKMFDHRDQALFDNGDGTFTPDDGVGNAFFTDGSQNCGVFYSNGQAPAKCRVASFTTVDLFGRWAVSKQFEVNVSVQNLFDRVAPFDAYLTPSYAINYSQAFHQSGAVGRFFTLGAKYTF